MPCHVPATSVSCRRRALYQKRPPTIAAKLDLSKPGEAWAEDYLRRASTGSDAFWRPLGIRRDAAALFVAVEWLIRQEARALFRRHDLAHRACGFVAQVPERQSRQDGACSDDRPQTRRHRVVISPFVPRDLIESATTTLRTPKSDGPLLELP
jgi:hypothetical protein